MTRYRCTNCGNTTEFDVTRTTRERALHHYTLGGELNREEVNVLSDDIEDVECRWCRSDGKVVVQDE